MADYDEPSARSSAVGPIVLLLVVGAAGYGGWRYLQSLPTTEVAPAAVAAPAEAAPATSTFASGPASGTKPDQSKGSAQAANGAPAGGATPAPGGPAGRRASTSAPAPVGPTAPGVSNTVSAAPSPAPAGSSAEPDRATPSGGPPAAPDSTIYDAANAGVKAPILITPGANTPLLTGVRHPAGTPGIEIVINADGFVGSVKAVTNPKSLAESLEYHNGLSVAKSWQFQPAERDGQPVRFRIFMPLSILRTRSAIK